MMAKNKLGNLVVLGILVLSSVSCRKDIGRLPSTGTAQITDASIYQSIKSSNGFSYYKHTKEVTASSKESPHNPWFRVRFNAIAAAALTDDGKLPATAVFPEGAIIVKELYQKKGGDLKYLAVMQKLAGHPNASGGWLWTEYDEKGKVVVGIGKKGNGCAGCHSSNDRDKVLLFDIFP